MTTKSELLTYPAANFRARKSGKKKDDFYVAPPVRWAFYAFLATIPFETVSLGVPVELTVISLAVLFLSLVFHLPLVFRKPPAAYWFFLLYWVVFALPVLNQNAFFRSSALWNLMVTSQLLVLSWAAFNLMLSDRVARNALLALAISCLFLSVLQFAGISASDGASRSARVTALGFHPNNIARILSLGLLILLGAAYAQARSLIKPLWLVWAGVGLIGLAIVRTGSRGALVALAAGIFVFVLRSGSIAVKIRNALLVCAGIGIFALASLQSENMRARFEDALEEGDLARREMIYPTAWQMFKEKPLLGWGPVAAEYELGARIAHVEEDRKNAHNMILNVLISTGLVGGIPFFTGTLLALWAAWKARGGTRGVLPLSLIAMVLVANMSGIWTGNKLHWIVVAYALSSVAAQKLKVKN